MVTNTMEARLGQKRPSENRRVAPALGTASLFSLCECFLICSCGSFDVFVDDDAAPGGPGAPPAAAAKARVLACHLHLCLADSRAAQWSTLGTQADIRKENTQARCALSEACAAVTVADDSLHSQAPSAWNNARVPQARAAPRGARAAFVLDVYEDEEFEEADAPAAAPAAHAPSLRKRLEDDVRDAASAALLFARP
jgi:hypothetical protein